MISILYTVNCTVQYIYPIITSIIQLACIANFGNKQHILHSRLCYAIMLYKCCIPGYISQ